ncbi:MAG: hypothetical protein JKY50_01740 [Oleispira sp.]|nr:hypothetical protein [Oleispira sp.]MBL4879908.1 hypothetical protein [Oleispira sp.]
MTEPIDQPIDSLITDPELVIGLIAAIGTDLELISSTITETLKSFNYTVDEIKLSSLLDDIPKYEKLKTVKSESEDVRIDAYMDAGDDLRGSTEQPDILALLSMKRISNLRKKKEVKKDVEDRDSVEPSNRRAYILNSLKNPKEVSTLRAVYGEAFLVVSIYAPKAERIKALGAKIAASKFETSGGEKYEKIATSLVGKDAKSKTDELGQDVSGTFPLADIFIRMDTKANLKTNFNRALNLWFQDPRITPSKDEFGMFQAKAVSLRSADLSRQVGAVIASENGEILSSGCNEVPKSGGGLYWEGDSGDDRDFQRGFDQSVKTKESIIGEILHRLIDNEWLSEQKKNTPVKELVNNILYGDDKSVLKDTRVSSIIEFGRIVHAEMAAIVDAARRGVSIKDSTLYCTTFPCHMCARHIIAAGIKRVVYVEPYPKSMAEELYERSVIVDGRSNESKHIDAVLFDPFVGISPEKYMEFFSMPVRKDNCGNNMDWDKRKSSPIIPRNNAVYIDLENIAIAWVGENKKSIFDENIKGKWEMPADGDISIR